MLALYSPNNYNRFLFFQTRHQNRFASIGTVALRRKNNEKRSKKCVCRAELSHDAPFAIAIGACILNSLVFPIRDHNEDDENSAINSTDARFAVMGIISFIPYFNWMSWIFAWLDGGKKRYLVYSLVYLAPYIRTNLSISPEESWLPIASIVVCIIHVQLEASIRSGDIRGIQVLMDLLNLLPTANGKRKVRFDNYQGISKKTKKKEGLPSGDEKSRSEIREWGVPRKPMDVSETNRDEGTNDKKKMK